MQYANLDAALEYVRKGWPVFPVAPDSKKPLTPNGFKDASTDPEQVEAWWTECPDANVGIPTGAVSGVIVIDCDVKNGQDGKNSFHSLRVPRTRSSRTPSGGWHAIFRHPGIEIRNRVGMLPGIDVRGDGGYIVVPPSTVNGTQYTWVVDGDIADMPSHLLELLQSKPAPKLNGSSGLQIHAGGRNDHLSRQAGALRGQGAELDVIEAALLAENEKRCEPPLPKAEIRQIAKSISRYEAPPGVSNWPEPTPLPDDLPPVHVFNPALLPETCQPWVEDVAERMQCPADYPSVAVMVVLSSLIGRGIGIRPKAEDTWTVVPNLWGAVIGRPGIMKSPALNEVLKFVKSREVEAGREFAEDERAHQNTVSEYKARRRHAEREYEKRLRNFPDAVFDCNLIEPEPPSRTRYVVNDSTVEKLGVLLNENPNGLLLFRDELVGFLRGMDRQGREGDRAFYLEAWNGDSSFTYDRIGRGTVEIEAACISILGGIQPGPLLQYFRSLSAIGAADDGFLQRFQLMVWPDVSKHWTNVDRPPNKTAFETINRLIHNLTTDRTDNGSSVSSVGTSVRRMEKFDTAALERFESWRAELERRIRAGQDHPAMESHLAKYRSLVPSLALIIHVAEGREGAVDETAVERAIGWSRYLETHARRVYHPIVSGAMDSARLLASKLLSGTVKRSFAARDIYRNCWSGLSDAQSVEQATAILEDFDWIIARRTPTAGRTRITFEVNPRIIEKPKSTTDRTDTSNVPF